MGDDTEHKKVKGTNKCNKKGTYVYRLYRLLV